jgi:hypothetical protein
MVAFLIELRLAQHADVNLRSDLIGILRLVLAVPPADRADVSLKVCEEPFSRGRYVPGESPRVVIVAEEHEMIQLQESLQPFLAEEIDSIANNGIQKFICGEHIQSHSIREIVAAQSEGCVDRQKMMLNIAQFLVDASQPQAEGL